MRYGYILVGAVIAAVVIVGGMVYTDMASVNKDKICENRFGENWTAQDSDIGNETHIQLTCTNGTASEEIGVEVEVNA